MTVTKAMIYLVGFIVSQRNCYSAAAQTHAVRRSVAAYSSRRDASIPENRCCWVVGGRVLSPLLANRAAQRERDRDTILGLCALPEERGALSATWRVGGLTRESFQRIAQGSLP